MNRSYSEMLKLKTFKERYEYLRIGGTVGEDTFGYERYLNQVLYGSRSWKDFRREIIIRDNGCDLAVDGREIRGRLIVHHINPITKYEILHKDPMIFDPENVVCVSHNTHEAIHFSNSSLLDEDWMPRMPNDTIPWR